MQKWVWAVNGSTRCHSSIDKSEQGGCLEDYPARMSEEDQIQEFGVRVMEELFQTLPGEKVLIKKYAPGEYRL